MKNPEKKPEDRNASSVEEEREECHLTVLRNDASKKRAKQSA